ncbi:hypothetical protein QBC35DRAFT_209199 [Podospora australis]|uniref:Uncharacterized protein n=1 Tax=Podospora australis TaxID=1536484 RepID=A0AAN6WU07_9PEZI|nr:hypothetical protein QBC35DRAFT_209199 [Podospora australis]
MHTDDDSAINERLNHQPARRREQEKLLPPKDNGKPGRYRRSRDVWWAWWWWESRALLVSITAMTLNFAVLSILDGLSLLKWKVPIQPSTILSIFAAIAKTAMMVPVASCLGELKWQYFAQTKARPLNHLQIFADASRGPWESLVLLLNAGKIREVIAWALALVTVVSLAIEPTTQQALELRTRDAASAVAGGELGVTDTYNPSYLLGDGRHAYDSQDDTLRALKYHSLVMNAAVGVQPQPDFRCPGLSTNCTFPPFTALGVCSTYADLTSELTSKCDTNDKNETVCKIQVPGFEGAQKSVEMRFNSIKEKLGATKRSHSLLQSFPTSARDSASFGNMAYLRVAKGENMLVDQNGLILQIPKLQLLESTWSWCAQSYHSASATSNGTLDLGSVSTETLHFSELDKDGAMAVFVANSTSARYRINVAAEKALTRLIEESLRSHVLLFSDAGTEKGYVGLEKLEDGTASSNLGYFLYQADILQVTEGIANAISSHLRNRREMAEINEGTTIVNGTAFVRETYFYVRWQWMVLPLSEVLLTAGLFVTMLLMMQSGPGGKKTLFKSSESALLFHGISDWTPGDTEGLFEGTETSDKLNDAAKRIMVELKDDDDDDDDKIQQTQQRHKQDCGL